MRPAQASTGLDSSRVSAVIRKSNWQCLGIVSLALVCGAASAGPQAKPAAIAVVEKFAHAVVTGDAGLMKSVWTTGSDTSTMQNGSGTFDRQTILRNLSEETKSATDLKFDLSNLRQIDSGKLALVTFQYLLDGGFAGRTIQTKGVGTALLRRESGRYRIVHLHMSHKRSVPAATPAVSLMPNPADVASVSVAALGNPAAQNVSLEIVASDFAANGE